ncbi:MAG: ATP-binding protein, partial [Actinomycetota bacterium]|nr:ATP-binding protein [Actinomycetota bacterium]
LRLAPQNLVSNALKFADGERPEVVIAARPAPEDAWEVSVADNGRGIAAEDQEAIFEAFQRGRAARDRDGGYGLGLAIAQRLVERHGGRIGVEAAPGGGSRFWFTMPGAVGSGAG